jgi:hypothetical protein
LWLSGLKEILGIKAQTWVKTKTAGLLKVSLLWKASQPVVGFPVYLQYTLLFKNYILSYILHIHIHTYIIIIIIIIIIITMINSFVYFNYAI